MAAPVLPRSTPTAEGVDVRHLVRVMVGLDPAFWWPRQERALGRFEAPA